MIRIAQDLCSKYNGDPKICTASILLHDVGLAHKRESHSPERHEERSIAFASELLPEIGIGSEESEEIIGCIKATEVSRQPKSINQKIVRTADALSHFSSIHYFAKAAFSDDWDGFIGWLKEKIEGDYWKVCFAEEKMGIAKVKEWLTEAVLLYEKRETDRRES